MQNLRDTPLTRDELNNIMIAMLTERQLREFETNMELNSSLDLGNMEDSA